MKVSIAPQHINHHDRAQQTDGSQHDPGAREQLKTDGQKEKRESKESNGKKTGNEDWLNLKKISVAMETGH